MNKMLNKQKEPKQIAKLRKLLDKANIPYIYTDDAFNTMATNEAAGFAVATIYPAFMIRLPNLKVDVILNRYSYGNEKGLLEIYGGMTEEELNHDSVLGFLSAEEAFKRIKYCYENNTTSYKT